MELDSFPFFDDDAETLQAILDLVEVDDASSANVETLETPDDAAVASSDDSSSTVAAEKIPKKPRQRKISGSTRMKNDVEKMRASVKELTKELELLQRRQRVQHSHAPLGAPVNPRMPKIWKSVAQRQYRARREAEVTNEQLRATMAEQRKVTQQILRALNRGTVKINPEITQLAHGDDSSSSTHIQNIVDNDASVEGAKCERLLRRLDSMMVQTETVIDSEFRSAASVSNKPTCDADGTIAVLDSRVVPFDSVAVGDAVWAYYADRTPDPSKPQQKAAVDQDVMIKGFRMTLGTAFQLGSVEGVIVGRRFVSRERTIIVWAADVASAGSGVLAPMASLLSLQAFGWNVISCAGRDGKPFTTVQMKHCVLPTGQKAAHIPFSGVMAGMVKKLVVQGVSEHQKTVHRQIDDALIGHCQGSATAKSTGGSLNVAASPFGALPGITLESW